MSANQNSPGTNCVTAIPTKEKKSQKPKILSILSTKKAVAKAKCPVINDLIDDLANVVSSIFLQNTKDQVKYKDYVLAYYYCLSLIFCDFN